MWFSYWEDQFDAYEGNVIAPGSEYPEVARQQYQRAKTDWDKKVEVANTKSQLAAYGVGFGISMLIILAIL